MSYALSYTLAAPLPVARTGLKGSHKLFLAESRGALWASNSYWLVRAERLANVFDRAGHDLEPGNYDPVTFRRLSEEPGVNMDAFTDPARYSEPCEYVVRCGSPVLVDLRSSLAYLVRRHDSEGDKDLTLVEHGFVQLVTGGYAARYELRQAKYKPTAYGHPSHQPVGVFEAGSGAGDLRGQFLGTIMPIRHARDNL